MKVIDLLNEIANGTQPKEIKFRETIYKWDEYQGDWGYVDKKSSPYNWFYNHFDCDSQDDLNEEIEIVEEISKLDLCDEYLFSNNLSREFTKEDRNLLDSNFKTIKEKFDELIDKVNKLNGS